MVESEQAGMKRILSIAVLLILGSGAMVWLYPRLVRPPVVTQTTPSVAQSPEDALFRGDVAAQTPIAAIVLRDIQQGIKPEKFKTGNRRFDGEWAIGTYQMAVMGLGQMILAHPELRAAYLPTIEQCVERLLQPEAIAFGTEAYGENGLAALNSAEGQVTPI
jgi:hypothetical protein